MGEAHIALAVEGVGWSHPDYFPLMVASSVRVCVRECLYPCPRLRVRVFL